MRSARILGLTWTVLVAGVTAGAAQTTPDRARPPTRLPGIVYPNQPEAAPRTPEQRSKGRRSQPPAAVVTPASSPAQLGVVAEPRPPRAPRSLTVKNEPETTAAVPAKSATARWVEPLVFSTPAEQSIRPQAVAAKGFVLASSFAFACASLGAAGAQHSLRGRSVGCSLSYGGANPS